MIRLLPAPARRAPTRRSASGSATLLGAVAESVVGARSIRAYGVAGRTARAARHARSTGTGRAAVRALRTSRDQLLHRRAGGRRWPPPAVVVVGVLLGVDGHLTVGQLTAFLFLVTLFIQPVQIATEVLNEAQNAVAGWRRVLDVLDVEPDVADPGDGRARRCRPGRSAVRFDTVSLRLPAAARTVLQRRRPGRSPAADPGRGGRRDRQRQDHLRQAADPADGPDQRRGAAVRRAADRGAVRARCAAGW